MKRTVFVAAGVAVLSLAVVLSSKLTAQTPGSGPAPAATNKSRVALMNLTYVIKYYKKFDTFQAELKASVDPFQKKDTEMKKEMETLAKDVQAPTVTAEKREQAEAKLKLLQRQIEDNKMEASKVLNKKQEDQLKILYGDVRVAAWRFAAAQGYDMVLHYNDAITDADYMTGPNIARKMQAGALMPVYMAAGVDVSEHIVKMLNDSMKGGTPAPATPRP